MGSLRLPNKPKPSSFSSVVFVCEPFPVGRLPSYICSLFHSRVVFCLRGDTPSSDPFQWAVVFQSPNCCLTVSSHHIYKDRPSPPPACPNPFSTGPQQDSLDVRSSLSSSPQVCPPASHESGSSVLLGQCSSGPLFVLPTNPR